MRLILFSCMIVLLIGFSLAEVTTDGGGSAFSRVEINSVTSFRIAVTNEAQTSDENISLVQVTLPTGFAYELGQGTDTGGSFSNYLRVLNWSGDGMIMNGSVGEFWFDARANPTQGDYGFTVITFDGNGIVENVNLTVRVHDLIAPNVNISSPQSDLYTNDKVLLNVSLNEKGSCMYSSDSGETNHSMRNTLDLIFYDNVSFFGKTTVNFYCSDIDGNENNSESVYFQIRESEWIPSNDSSDLTNTSTSTPSQTNDSSLSESVSSSTKEANIENSTSELVGEEGKGSLFRWVIVGLLAGVGLAIVLFLVFKLKSPYERER